MCVDEILKCDQMKATEQYFSEVLIFLVFNSGQSSFKRTISTAVTILCRHCYRSLHFSHSPCCCYWSDRRDHPPLSQTIFLVFRQYCFQSYRGVNCSLSFLRIWLSFPVQLLKRQKRAVIILFHLAWNIKYFVKVISRFKNKGWHCARSDWLRKKRFIRVYYEWVTLEMSALESRPNYLVFSVDKTKHSFYTFIFK